jgi:choline dehydrogenase-like flavoprotein
MVERISADVVVVGSGAGGAAVAGELAAAGRKVLILEAGPRQVDWPGAHARNADPSEAGLTAFGRLLDAHLVYPSRSPTAIPGLAGYKVAHLFGGMFALWTCNCPDPDSLELPPWDDQESWRTYLGRARKLLHVSQDIGRHGARMQRLLSATKRAVGALPAERDVQPMPVAARIEDGKLIFSSAGDLLRADTLPAGQLRIVTDVIVRRIAHRGSKATGVIFAPRTGGPETEATGDCVVVAAGTVGSAKLLAASALDCGPALGCGVYDHPAFASRVRLRAEIGDGVPEDDPIFTVWVPFSEPHPWHNQLCLFPGLPAPLSMEARDREMADIFTWVPMEIDSDNRLRFHLDRLDPFGLPEVSGTFRHSRDTRQRASLGLAEHFRIASEIGDLQDGWHPAFYKAGESTHLMGTCRMGPRDDGTSVVDRLGKLWRYENIYVSGNAVLAQSNAGNPTLTTIAAALRTANAIHTS